MATPKGRWRAASLKATMQGSDMRSARRREAAHTNTSQGHTGVLRLDRRLCRFAAFSIQQAVVQRKDGTGGVVVTPRKAEVPREKPWD